MQGARILSQIKNFCSTWNILANVAMTGMTDLDAA